MLRNERKQIDDIDNQIMKLLDERFEVVKKVKEIKNKNGLKILNESREGEILSRISDTKYDNKEYIKEVYVKIMKESKKLQNV